MPKTKHTHCSWTCELRGVPVIWSEERAPHTQPTMPSDLRKRKRFYFETVNINEKTSYRRSAIECLSMKTHRIVVFSFVGRLLWALQNAWTIWNTSTHTLSALEWFVKTFVEGKPNENEIHRIHLRELTFRFRRVHGLRRSQHRTHTMWRLLLARIYCKTAHFVRRIENTPALTQNTRMNLNMVVIINFSLLFRLWPQCVPVVSMAWLASMHAYHGLCGYITTASILLYLQGPLISRTYLRANWILGFHRTGAGWLPRPVSAVHPFRLNFLFLAFTNFPFLYALFFMNRFYFVDRRKWKLFIHTPIGMHISVDAFSSCLTSATTSFLQLITFFSLSFVFHSKIEDTVAFELDFFVVIFLLFVTIWKKERIWRKKKKKM